MSLPAFQPVALSCLMRGDLAELATHWQRRGHVAYLPEPGMLQLCAAASTDDRLLISVGVHGNERLPIEMLAPVIDTLLKTPQALRVNLLLIVGNPEALTINKRFVDIDLNRLFGRPTRTEKIVRDQIGNDGDRNSEGGTEDTRKLAETARAAAIMRVTTDFFETEGAFKWHLDLHSTIRPSLHPRFAIVPALPDDLAQQPLTAWLGRAGMQAIVFNNLPSATFSAFTSQECDALSCTVELGQVGASPTREMASLSQTQQALEQLLHAMPLGADARSNFPIVTASGSTVPELYCVAREVIKRDESFVLHLPSAAPNFSSIAANTAFASSGATTVNSGPATEYVLFPNPDVKIGQRAALMIVVVN
ncbi:MAG: succinylglutamate desuccinylase [Pseudomonadota bacterium]